MNLDLLTASARPIPLHAFAALSALALGVLQMTMPKGTTLHRSVGYVWVTAMAVVAVSGLFIHEVHLIGPFSPIHLLSLFTLYTLVIALHAARKGEIKKHRREMRILFFLGLLLAGVFTLIPGRLMHSVFFAVAA